MAYAATRSKRRKKRRKDPCKLPRKRQTKAQRKACAKRRAAERKPAQTPTAGQPAPRPPAQTQPVPPPPAPASAPPPAPAPPPGSSPPPVPPSPPPGSGHVSTLLARYSGPFGRREAERLLWRAGFGPSPGHAEALAAMGLQNAVLSLTRPAGEATLTGAEPTDGKGPLEPEDAWGDDHLWFLDRMVRTSQPLIERMTLIWHDWFATSVAGAEQRFLIAQNKTLRRNALGSFRQLALDVTIDPAMILWLNANDNTRSKPNENYARELMELFTLGADREAYSEQDVRELARCLTGWRNSWSAELGSHDFRFDPNRHDSTSKTVFGRSGNWNWDDGVRLCLENPKHASFFVEKLWSYFIPTPPSAADRDALAEAYASGGYEIRPVVEAILVHPDLHSGPRMVKSPVVFTAGMLRQQRRSIDTSTWVWLGEGAGQRLFMPPNVSGWDDAKWLDTSTLRARWMIVAQMLNGRHVQGTAFTDYDPTETPAQAVAAARAFWGDPALTPSGLVSLEAFAATCLPAVMAGWEQKQYRALRQNALRQLLAVSPDLQTS